jgi:hypothetical protein
LIEARRNGDSGLRRQRLEEFWMLGVFVLTGEAAIFAAYFFTKIAFLWYNVPDFAERRFGGG